MMPFSYPYPKLAFPITTIFLTLMLVTGLAEATKPIVERSHINAWGARQSGDRIKMAGIQAKYLLLTGDQVLFDEIVNIIEGEIKFATGRGMQHDFGFHHRVDRVDNTVSDGLDYANVFAEWALIGFYRGGTAPNRWFYHYGPAFDRAINEGELKTLVDYDQ